MARKEPTQTMKVGAALVARARCHADKIGWSFNQFGEEAIRLLCDMIEDEETRVLPRVVKMLDAVKTPAAANIYKLPDPAPALARVAETPASMKTRTAG